MNLLTVKETSEKWGISERMIRKLCAEKRIPEADLISGTWMIPDGAPKPVRKPMKKREKKKQPLSAFTKQVIYQRRKNNHYGVYEYIQVYLSYSSNRMTSSRLTKKSVEEIYRKNKIPSSFKPSRVNANSLRTKAASSCFLFPCD